MFHQKQNRLLQPEDDKASRYTNLAKFLKI